MIDSLETQAEKRALAAEELRAFSGLKLLHIKRQLEVLLDLIGRNEIFDQYTDHKISHIDRMLRVFDWLIPEGTKEIMSPADWLLTVLAVYFHDLGMLVTRHEYEMRAASGFAEFRDRVLFAGDDGADYRAKVEVLPPNEAERFLYQEFVRHNHAERIRWWIQGEAPHHLGVSHSVGAEVNRLLGYLGPQFRRDLGLVCESHHLDDLADVRKYQVSQPYGNSNEETANLQYSAILLRTADLLDITSERTPSVEFRTINPTDPLSQQEWAKQMAVKSVRSKLGLDRERNPDARAPRDTIEVHAYFTEPNGFFGLTSYLLYAREQIRKSYDWAEGSAKQQGARHLFPWRYIDDANIETEGFIRDTFEFTIDQARVLDLLTGHTLYNDTSVVLRELVQNALDAVRLRRLQDERERVAGQPGRVTIRWDSAQRVLSVEDNGTGMTQDIVVRHLLKVGASRYQDPEFRKEYPEFSAISRFGIGVLSAFMIADTVEITTCHPEEDKARRLSLRSVHGKYLIRLMDKHADVVARRLAPHGTLFSLKVRASAEVPDVLEAARNWIVVPDCEVTVELDEQPPIKVGFSSPREALSDVLLKLGIRAASTGERLEGAIRIEEEEQEGTQVAYAVKWSEFFRDWSFMEVPNFTERRETSFALGTCIEGIRVEFDTPGFSGRPILALANTKGAGAPRTNVARSGLETTPQRDAMLRSVYSLYCAHVGREVEQLHAERDFSLAWAVQEAGYLLGPLLRGRQEGMRALSEGLLEDAIRQVPALLAEEAGVRKALRPSDVSHWDCFWTIDCALFRSAEGLIRELRGSASLSSLFGNLLPPPHLPNEPLLCDPFQHGSLDKAAFEGREVDTIVVYRDERRVDFRWSRCTDPPRWVSLTHAFLSGEGSRLINAFNVERFGRRHLNIGRNILIGKSEVGVSGLSDELAISSHGTTFLLPNTSLAEFLVPFLKTISAPDERIILHLWLALIVQSLLELPFRLRNPDFLKNATDTTILALNFASERVAAVIQPYVERIGDMLRATTFKEFSTSAWVRGEE